MSHWNVFECGPYAAVVPDHSLVLLCCGLGRLSYQDLNRFAGPWLFYCYGSSKRLKPGEQQDAESARRPIEPNVTCYACLFSFDTSSRLT